MTAAANGGREGSSGLELPNDNNLIAIPLGLTVRTRKQNTDRSLNSEQGERCAVAKNSVAIWSPPQGLPN